MKVSWIHLFRYIHWSLLTQEAYTMSYYAYLICLLTSFFPQVSFHAYIGLFWHMKVLFTGLLYRSLLMHALVSFDTRSIHHVTSCGTWSTSWPLSLSQISFTRTLVSFDTWRSLSQISFNTYIGLFWHINHTPCHTTRNLIYRLKSVSFRSLIIHTLVSFDTWRSFEYVSFNAYIGLFWHVKHTPCHITRNLTSLLKSEFSTGLFSYIHWTLLTHEAYTMSHHAELDLPPEVYLLDRSLLRNVKVSFHECVVPLANKAKIMYFLVELGLPQDCLWGGYD